MIAAALNVPHREMAAYHESGHACMVALLNRRVDNVTIDPQPGGGGLCKYHLHLDKPNEEIRELIISVAGPLAGAMRECALSYRATCRSDMLAAAKIVGSDIAGLIDSPRFIAAERIAKEKLTTNWGAVVAVADWIVERGSIRGELVHEICCQYTQKLEARNANR